MSETNKATTPRGGISAVTIIVVIAILLVLAALILPFKRDVREAKKKLSCLNYMKKICLALHNYSETYNGLPPAYTVDEHGNRLHSWRTLILPFVGEKALYESIDLTKPWDDPANKKAYETATPFGQCPSLELKANHTTYLGLVGKDFFFHPVKSRQLSEIMSADGTTQTLMLVEVPAEKAVHWMSPHDIEPEVFIETIREETLPHDSEVINVIYADGHHGTLHKENSAKLIRALSTIAGGEELKDEDF